LALIKYKLIDYFDHFDYNSQKGIAMQKVTASEIKQNSTILQNALRDDILVTKRDKPFVVIMDYEKYKNLISKTKKNKNWIDEAFGIMSEKEADGLLRDIKSSRVDKKTDDICF
jgi:prevent-host-death family protein